jgi:hypothetical protein
VEPLARLVHEGKLHVNGKGGALDYVDMSAADQRKAAKALIKGEKPGKDAKTKNDKPKRPNLKTRKDLANAFDEASHQGSGDLAWISALLDAVNGEATDEDAYNAIPPEIRNILEQHIEAQVFVQEEPEDDAQTSIPGSE